MNKKSRSTWDAGARVTQAFENDNYREGQAIAPDYSGLWHIRVDPLHKRHGIGVRPTVTPAAKLFIGGALAALFVLAIAAW